MNFKILLLLFPLKLFFLELYQKNFQVCGSPTPASASWPCWKGDVRSNNCIESLIKKRRWSANSTLSNIAIVERLLAEGRIPNLMASNPNSLNVAVGCLQNENLLPYDEDCSACGTLCVTTLKTQTELCALYCPTSPAPPLPRTTFGLHPGVAVTSQSLSALVGREGPEVPSSNKEFTTLVSQPETIVPERKVGALIGAVIIGLVTLAGIVILVALFCWRHYRGDPTSMGHKTRLMTPTESNTLNRSQSEELEMAAVTHRPQDCQPSLSPPARNTLTASEEMPFIDVNPEQDYDALNGDEQSMRQRPDGSIAPAGVSVEQAGIQQQSAMPDHAA